MMAAKKRRVPQETISNREKYMLKGNVWQVRQSRYYTIVRRKGIVECRYDEHGYRKNTLYNFNENGLVTDKMYYDMRDGYYHDIFNTEGQHTDSNHYAMAGNLLVSAKRGFNEKGLLTSMKRYDASGVLTSAAVWAYDDNDVYAEFYDTDAEGKKLVHHKFVNDENGCPVDQIIYNKEGALEKKILSKYNEYGHATETKHVLADGTNDEVKTFTYQYDSNGKMTIY